MVREGMWETFCLGFEIRQKGIWFQTRSHTTVSVILWNLKILIHKMGIIVPPAS